ncbi:MAG: Fe-S cluster assembly ATPase SufC [Betaproteobacteria bacterium]|nr:Fe-S cluster assembly ATPase SufC [Betaproteobacteria bacterium]
MLVVQNLHARVGDKDILKGVNLEIPEGEIHVVMGPNGVGKSTMGHVLLGHKSYEQTAGRIILDGTDITDFDTAQRAKAGLFLAFQYPVSIPGLRVSEYLRNLYCLRHNVQVGVAEFRKIVREKLDMLNIDRSALSRYLNDGFSGGEMKRLEMLQLALIKPKVAILDEIDSGVDVDAQKTVAEVITRLRETDGTSFVIITHYQRLLNFVKPDKVHVVLDGRVTRSGDMSLVQALEREGYDWVRQMGETASASASL